MPIGESERTVPVAVVTGPAQWGRLRLGFESPSSASDYFRALVSLMHGYADSCFFMSDSGPGRDDLDLGEIVQLVRSKAKLSLQLGLRLSGEAERISIDLDADVVTIRSRLVFDREATGLAWFQTDFDHLAPLLVIALPVHEHWLSADALHSFVAIAARCGGFRDARLEVEGDSDARYFWDAQGKKSGKVPLVGAQDESVWLAEKGAAPMKAVAWFHPPSDQPETDRITPDWWFRFDTLCRSFDSSRSELEQHLQLVVQLPWRWRIEDLNTPHHVDFLVPAETGIALALVPKEAEVVVALDRNLPAEKLLPLLLHALAHLALGHVQPGDKWGHWDTVETATALEPHRHWDRSARDYVSSRLKRPADRRVEKLEECTPVEKAQLGLWRMIGEMLGESRRLHPAAVRYQKAVYQRQAAQRMVAMLEEYGGSMLCDGVGLGKTYVATTLIVHYANAWREQWAQTPERLVDDPFRVTVLAPHSVVSTWKREALPELASFGVPPAAVRVMSHTKLSRISTVSELLESARGGVSDLEHLLLSDLVVVDEAHNFRSLAARRTKVLRDLLRLQPRRESRRRVALLTATPVNNSLEDLRQEASLLFSRSLSLSDARTDDGYRRQAVGEVRTRCKRARSSRSNKDVAALVAFGQAEAKFSDAIDFRDDLDFGPNVQRIGDYLREEDERLLELQESIRAAAHNHAPREEQPAPVRIAEELLDRIVVQRSRSLCKEIERQQGSSVELLFRPDADVPEKLYYSDEYDGIPEVLSRFLPLFDRGKRKPDSSLNPLSFKVHMWYDVREGIKSASDTSSVVGLQRVLVLKRLESSPVSFLITLLRLVVLHAYRLDQLRKICLALKDKAKQTELQASIEAALKRLNKADLEKLLSLAAGASSDEPRRDFLAILAKAHKKQPTVDTDDPSPMMSLFSDQEEGGEERQQLDRLWGLREALVNDFATLLEVTPDLADIVFGRFKRSEWPRQFIAGNDSVDWPRSAKWGQRLVTDPKIHKLVSRLVQARRAKQKVIVFSQFSDTIAYLRSVLDATRSFQRTDWQLVLHALDVKDLTKEEIVALREATAAISGDTADRDDVVNAFAPFYRIGPWRPAASETTDAERKILFDSWETDWTGAMIRPIDILFSTDVLAEGVNLQDAALLINYDIHWNPVRMIQRSGRIDRRLNPRIEKPREFPNLVELATRLGKEAPRYYWHDHPEEAPVTVNMILPDELEAELLLRERIATKTMAIDFTLGLEQGTGAEAEWMEDYCYHGIKSLNSFQRDRAIEQIASHHERLSRLFLERGIRTEWAENLNSWFRSPEAEPGSPLIGRALLGRRGGDLERFTRYLEPVVKDGVPYWLWAEKKPGDSMFDGWLILDGRPEHFPPKPQRDIPFNENSATPLKAQHLLIASEFLLPEPVLVVLPTQDILRPLQQGGSALAAPKFGSEQDRLEIKFRDYFILQISSFDPNRLKSTEMKKPDSGENHDS